MNRKEKIDLEVRKIIDECYKKGMEIIQENRKLLDLIAKHLVEVETLTKEDIDELLNTGRLNWWEKKKAKMQEEMNAQAEEVVVEDNTTEVSPEGDSDETR